jgi:two-component system, OmpR family, sensor histidine kinase BaeS
VSPRSFATRIAMAAIAVSALAVAVIAGGVLVVGASIFDALMRQHGTSTAASQAMFNQSVTQVLLAAAALAIFASIILAFLLGRSLERPLDQLARAARSIAGGRYEARVERPAAPELASVADSFNQMAASLQDQERLRRDLIQNFAHELRTPLTNLHGYLEGLREGVVPAEPGVFGSLQDEVARLRRLSDSLDVLAAGLNPGHQLEELDLVRLIRAVLELNGPRIQRSALKLELDLPTHLWVQADPDVLAQVVGNLVQNATRYSPAGATIWVRAGQERDSTVVSVANSGPSIPPDDLSHVFERFYRVEKSRDPGRGGAGIGLAIVKQLVEAAGGQVGAESSAGQTRFWFSLPA